MEVVIVEREIVVGVTRVVEIADSVVCRQLRFIITWQLSVFTSAPNSHVAIGLLIPATRTEDKTRQEAPAHHSPQGQPQKLREGRVECLYFKRDLFNTQYPAGLVTI